MNCINERTQEEWSEFWNSYRNRVYVNIRVRMELFFCRREPFIRSWESCEFECHISVSSLQAENRIEWSHAYAMCIQ